MSSNLLDLSGKVAIVTGGAVGIGLGIVNRFAEAGASVMIADRSPEDSEKAVSDLTNKGFKVKATTTDVSSENDVKHLVEETVKAFGVVDILVNNAGIYPNIPLSKMTSEDFEKVINFNLEGVF